VGNRKGFIIIILALSAVAFGGAGCGDSSEGSAVTKKEFTNRSNAICKEWQLHRTELAYKNAEKYGTESLTPAEKEKTVSALLDYWDEAVENLNDLTAPSGEEAKVEALIAEMEAASDKLRQEPENRTIGKSDPFRKANAMADAYGLRECYL
jgi:hypothetical protein